MFHEIESVIGNLDQKALEQKLNALLATFEHLNATRPGISGRAYRIAAANLAKGHGEVIRITE